jgi:hypothetical protein
MGISLTDLGNFATGAIERDREITNENLKIRAEELQANRDLMIAMKKDKYAADIAEYKKEKAKANEINRLNAVAAKGDMDSNAYAQQYLMATLGTEKYKAMQQTDPEGFKDMIANFGGAKDYKFTLDRNSLDKQLETDTKIINKGFSKAIENAKGDSFLINKILGKKSSVNDDVNATIEDQLKAAQVVKEETVGSDTDLSTITFKESKGRLRTPSKDYNDAWKAAYKDVNFDLSAKNNKSFKYLNKFSSMGGANELSLKFDKSDGKIVGHNANSITNLLAMEKMYTTIRDNKDAVTAYNVNKQPTSIRKNFNNDTVFNEMSNIINQGRVTNIKGRDISSDGSNKYNLTTFVPLSVVGENGEINLGDAGTLTVNKKEMQNISKLMSDFIIAKAKDNPSKNLDSQTKVSAVYSELFEGNADTINEFKNYLYTNDANVKSFYDGNINKTEDNVSEDVSTEGTSQDKTIQDNKPKSIKTNVRLLPDGSGFVRGNEKFTWENIKNSKQENKLTVDEKIEYDKWNANQNNVTKEPITGTTFKDIQASTDANTQKITEAFTDSEGNFEKMKTNKTNIRPFSKG